jgi:hypothetical protein
MRASSCPEGTPPSKAWRCPPNQVNSRPTLCRIGGLPCAEACAAASNGSRTANAAPTARVRCRQKANGGGRPKASLCCERAGAPPVVTSAFAKEGTSIIAYLAQCSLTSALQCRNCFHLADKSHGERGSTLLKIPANRDSCTLSLHNGDMKRWATLIGTPRLRPIVAAATGLGVPGNLFGCSMLRRRSTGGIVMKT